ncbi:histidine kinase [Bizionia argentinensis JUB59]|uniref:Histidine kinase n=1 Tax=Bizionia argentinensis JUB59 TaxID=1046627 RepID=G2EBE1_9FLAO|nr:2TM domain-containing protein [Bizionia argentinensis]EGV44239.1 histidine kinase [Bizionia argentinensis JUB59]
MNRFIKNIALVFGIGIVVFVIGNALSGGFESKSADALFTNFMFYQLYAFVLGYSNMQFFYYIGKYNLWNDQVFNRILFGIVGSVVITLIGLFFLHMFESMVYENESFSTFVENESYRDYIFGLWMSITIVIVFHAVFFFKQAQEKKVKESQIVAQTQTAKFDALKNQLDPHFLFNSLNVLSSLIEENPENAQKFTTSLSKIYRYVLEQKNKDLVSVDDELEFARTYMLLLKMRFEDSLIFDIPEQSLNPDSKVVPLSLQLLLENAVKHNMVTSSKPLHIKIYEHKGNLVVENNLQTKQVLKKGSGVGLSNITERYALLTAKKVFINQEATVFAVSIPMLTKQMTIMDPQNSNNKEEAYYRAKKQVEEIKGFYGNLISYCLVIPFLFFINYRTSWNFQWFWFPMFGWGMGIIFHAFNVFGYGKSWEDRKVQEILNQDDNIKKWN